VEIYLDELRGAIKKNSAKDTRYMGRNFGPRLADNTTTCADKLGSNVRFKDY
jgi:hypothetical protein